jgi:uroporphyrinogen-III decarboxylase
MMTYFGAFPRQVELMRTECGTVSAIAGIFKAPLDILADKLRGYMGLAMDLMERPDKVRKACEALAPHLLHVAYTSSDPTGAVPIGFWMHRSCVPFISQEHFDSIQWPTLKPIIEELWRRGRQTLFYAEGKWGPHLKAFATLPEKSIVFHCDRDDIFEASRILSPKFCVSGGIPNMMLAYGKPQEVRDHVKKVIQYVTKNGSYILDASDIVQNDATVENVKAMTEAGREFGAY